MGSIAEVPTLDLDPGVYHLFEEIENSFKDTGLGAERWYIMVISVLVGGTEPELSRQLYLYLIQQPAFHTSASRQHLIRRLREALVKAVSIVGVCKPLEAIMAINQVEQEEDKDHTSTREAWQCDQANSDRAMTWMRKLYSKNTDSTLALFQDHKDFAWLSQNITYGLYLSDRQVLDDLDTQMVVLPGIMIQNLPNETRWHIRGTRRLGVSKEDVQIVWNGVNSIATRLGIRVDKVPTVDAVEPEV